MVFYFAFGSNMARDVFLRRRTMRCDAEGERAELRDHRLAFTEPGLVGGIEPAFANIEPAPGRSVHGVLWKIPDEEFKRLLTTESPNYEPVEVEVQAHESGTVKAMALRSRKLQPDTPPSRRYLGLLLAGAREHGLPAEYIAELAARRTAYVPIVSELFEHVAVPVVSFWFAHGRRILLRPFARGTR